MPKLTEAFVARATCPPGAKQTFFTDSGTPGFQLRVGTTGSKTYCLYRRIAGKPVRLTIGSAGTWTLGAARTRAQELSMAIDRGEDPRASIAAVRAAEEQLAEAQLRAATKTVGVLVESYLNWLSNSGRQQTAKGYERITRNWLEADFAAKAASEVTSAQVAALLRKPFEAGHVRTAGTLRAILSAAFNAASKAALDPRMPQTLQGFGVTTNPIAPVPAFPVGTSEVFASLQQMRKYAQTLQRSVSTRGIDANMTDAFLLVHILLGAPRLAQLRRATSADWAGGTLVLEDLKTGGAAKPKRLVFPAATMAADLLDACTARATATGCEFLFAAAKQSQPVTTTGVSTRAHKLLGGLSPASLRRGVETALAEAGVQYELRSRLLGHGLSGVVYRHYNRADHSEDMRKVLTQWEEMLLALQAS